MLNGLHQHFSLLAIKVVNSGLTVQSCLFNVSKDRKILTTMSCKACNLTEKPGEVWAICGETNVTSSEGVIRSPLYPKPYPANTRCQWFIYVEPGRTLSLRWAHHRDERRCSVHKYISQYLWDNVWCSKPAYLFCSVTHLDIEETKRCVFDQLTAYDGPDNMNSSRIFGPLCGEMTSNDDSDDAISLTTTFSTSSSDVVMIEFTSDIDVSFTGFEISFRQTSTWAAQFWSVYLFSPIPFWVHLCNLSTNGCRQYL